MIHLCCTQHSTLSHRSIHFDAPVQEQFSKIFSIRIKALPDYCVVYGHGRLLLESELNKDEKNGKNRMKIKKRKLGSFVSFVTCVQDNPQEKIGKIYRNELIQSIQPVLGTNHHIAYFEKPKYRYLHKTRFHSVRKVKNCIVFKSKSGSSLELPFESISDNKVVSILPSPGMLDGNTLLEANTRHELNGENRFRREMAGIIPVLLFVDKGRNYSFLRIRESIQARHFISFLLHHNEFHYVMNLIDILWEKPNSNLVDGDGVDNIIDDASNSDVIEHISYSVKNQEISKDELVQLYLESYFCHIENVDHMQFDRVTYYLSTEYASSKSFLLILESVVTFYEVCQSIFIIVILFRVIFILSLYFLIGKKFCECNTCSKFATIHA